MGAIGQLLYWLLKAILPWLFSGEETSRVSNTRGLVGMDDLNHRGIPKIAVLLAVLALSGCTLGGARVEHHYHLVEPGDVVEVIEGKVKVRNLGTSDVGDYDPVGKMLIPKSVYRKMREAWIEKNGGE